MKLEGGRADDFGVLKFKGGLARAAFLTLASLALLAPAWTGSLSRPVDRPLTAIAATNCDNYYSDSVPPTTIKVLVHNPDRTPNSVQTVPFEPYVENVVPNEWYSGWDPASLEAGAIAAKLYAWYWVNQGGKGSYNGQCYDVQDNTFDQVYRQGSAQPSTSAAVQTTWSTNALENGRVFQAHYCSDMNCQEPPAAEGCGTGVNGQPNTNGTLMSQVGTQACAQKGLSYQQILQTYYYPNLSFTTSVAPVPTLAAFQANGGQLWTVGSVGWTNWGVGLAPGTSPSVAMLPRGGFEVAFQAAGGRLWTVGAAGWVNWGVGLAPGTHPSIAVLSNGGIEIAFQGYGGHLWTVGAGGWADWGVGLDSGTSPVIVPLAGNGFEIAFHGAGGQLWTVGTAGWADWGVGLAPGTNPAVSVLPAGGYELAFQGAGGHLWTAGAAGWRDWGVGVAAGTDPALTGLSNGALAIAFQAPTGHLWTVGSIGYTDWGLAMAHGTSPAIIPAGGGLLESYQGSDGRLWTVSSGGYGWSLGMAPGTSVFLR